MAPQHSATPTGPPRHEALRVAPRPFECTAESVASVRAMVADHLGSASPECRDAAVLVASELASNVVGHARTPYQVGLSIGQTVRIEVTDGAAAVPVLRPAPPDAESGRGLVIVTSYSSRWGVDRLDGAKTVWAEVEFESPE